jgi:hypothetical protein
MSNPSLQNHRMQQLIRAHAVMYNAAQRDGILRTKLRDLSGNAGLGLPHSSPLNSATSVFVEWNLRAGRKIYSGDADDLAMALSESNSENAYAIEGTSDRHWVVVTYGLMRLLHAKSKETGARVALGFADTFKTPLGQWLMSRDTINGAFDTVMEALMYACGISFFASHEIGHHLGGHLPVFRQAAHVYTAGVTQGSSGLPSSISQALERKADQLGVTGAIEAMSDMLLQNFYAAAKTEQLYAQAREVAAFVFATGVLMAHVLYQPNAILWEEGQDGSHPPDMYRLFVINEVVRNALIKFKLPEEKRKAIGDRSLNVVLGNANALKLLALRDNPRLATYTSILDRAYADLFPRLRPLVKPLPRTSSFVSHTGVRYTLKLTK